MHLKYFTGMKSNLNNRHTFGTVMLMYKSKKKLNARREKSIFTSVAMLNLVY